jgi:hypothetical protein
LDPPNSDGFRGVSQPWLRWFERVFVLQQTQTEDEDEGFHPLNPDFWFMGDL